AMFFGEKTERTGTNGKKERTTQGAISFVNENYDTNVVDYPTDSSLTWLQGGEDWMDENLELLFRFGRRRKLGICGNGALLGIMKLAKNGADIKLTPMDIEFGISVREWVTPFGTLYLNTHPLFTQRVYNTNSILIIEPENVEHAVLDDTMFQDDIAPKDFDGDKSQWLTELGFQFNHPKTMGYMTGVGLTGV
ncbi:MAG: SU10 major capsid protein, partial [Candidatus Thorarchaeota archaeon]